MIKSSFDDKTIFSKNVNGCIRDKIENIQFTVFGKSYSFDFSNFDLGDVFFESWDNGQIYRVTSDLWKEPLYQVVEDMTNVPFEFDDIEIKKVYKNIQSSREPVKSDAASEQKLKEDLIRQGYTEEEANQIVEQRKPQDVQSGKKVVKSGKYLENPTDLAVEIAEVFETKPTRKQVADYMSDKFGTDKNKPSSTDFIDTLDSVMGALDFCYDEELASALVKPADLKVSEVLREVRKLNSARILKSSEHTQEEIDFVVDQEMESWLDRHPTVTELEYSEARKGAEEYVLRMLNSSTEEGEIRDMGEMYGVPRESYVIMGYDKDDNDVFYRAGKGWVTENPTIYDSLDAANKDLATAKKDAKPAEIDSIAPVDSRLAEI